MPRTEFWLLRTKVWIPRTEIWIPPKFNLEGPELNSTCPKHKLRNASDWIPNTQKSILITPSWILGYIINYCNVFDRCFIAMYNPESPIEQEMCYAFEYTYNRIGTKPTNDNKPDSANRAAFLLLLLPHIAYSDSGCCFCCLRLPILLPFCCFSCLVLPILLPFCCFCCLVLPPNLWPHRM